MQISKLTAMCVMTALLAACGGGSGGGSSASVAPVTTTAPPPPPSVASPVTVSGKLTYARVPHNENSGLDYAATMDLPIRGAVVEALDGSGAVLETTLSEADGSYSLTLDADTDMRLQVKAQLLSDEAAKWDFQVTDNTQSDALYALQGSLASTGNRAAQTRHLYAPHGWTGEAYGEARSAAPFAILDSVYTAVQAFAEVDPNIDFPPLELHWSVNNRTAAGNKSQGQIGNTAYFPEGDSGAVFILGQENQDTDEYDPHVIIHEWGHYFEHQMSRADSIGGLHALNDRLDARVAFSEGWSNALSAIITGDPVYKDSSGAQQNAGFSYDLETRDITNAGWFNEASVGAIIYDIFDNQPDDADNISSGLAPFYTVMRSDAYRNSPTFATIFALTDGLRLDSSISRSDLSRLLESHGISGEGPNGSGEINNGAIRTALPVYKEISSDNGTLEICTTDDAGVFNKLGNRDFIFMTVDREKRLSISVTKQSGDDGRDPDFNIWQGGELIHSAATAAENEEVFTGTLQAGDYILEAYDFNNINATGRNRGDGCFELKTEG